MVAVEGAVHKQDQFMNFKFTFLHANHYHQYHHHHHHHHHLFLLHHHRDPLRTVYHHLQDYFLLVLSIRLQTLELFIVLIHTLLLVLELPFTIVRDSTRITPDTPTESPIILIQRKLRLDTLRKTRPNFSRKNFIREHYTNPETTLRNSSAPKHIESKKSTVRPIEIHRILNLVAILVAKHVIDQVTLILAANFAARLVSTTAVTSRPLLVAWIATREAEGKNLSEISTQNNPHANERQSSRYDDGEVTRYGAGESYRPFNSNRSPRRARSPPRGRSPPIIDSDRYIPGRSPRRRSRSTDRYRREPSRDRRDTREMGDSWRRRDRSRSLRRSPPRRSPPRRSPPRRSPPRRFSPRRDDRDRLRSPRRGYDSRFPPPPHNDNPNAVPLTLAFRRRSRSPFDRDRGRERSPLRRSPPPVQRASTYRVRSRSPERRDDRYGPSYSRRPSPPRESAISSAIPSRDTSRRSSPHPLPLRRDDRSRQQSQSPPRPRSRSSAGIPVRERSPQGTPKESFVPPKSPPRGPAALRVPPTGPRETRIYGGQSGGAIGPPPRPAPVMPTASSQHNVSPGAPPSGPRGYVSSRGGGYSRGGRGGPSWGSTIQSRNLLPATGPVSASAVTGASSIPTGPRAGSISQSVPTTPINQSKPFNPPKGPAAESNRPSLAQSLLQSLPPIIPGGKMDAYHTAIATGVMPELQAHTAQLKEEEEKLRAEKYVKEEKLRKSLAMWDKFEREAKVLDLRLELSENSVKKFAGESVSKAAF
ncbi:uncharacterized protein GGS25DRAFT_519692 [Hypoxylon fragiforme]|uniref:uncharacterized protein n=1 Tax=Hypoxylon fragiforme TaxID=63214 RepID=UPI0020C6007A|nr:uncharacterized protein GGS25DRAFT_519692 [Hypoxylon fragiforme]KAI2611385.1 hypothetical protein GGS25DRAFT_519692 [Hypoxylon fragiforme]